MAIFEDNVRGDDLPRLERQQRGVVRGGHDQPRRVRQRERHRAAQAGRVRQVVHARRRLLGRSQGRRHPPERTRWDVRPRVLQLRHRHPRRVQRAAAPGVPRLHPDSARPVADDERHCSTSATRCSCSTASRSPRCTASSRRTSTASTRPTPRPPARPRPPRPPRPPPRSRRPRRRRRDHRSAPTTATDDRRADDCVADAPTTTVARDEIPG